MYPFFDLAPHFLDPSYVTELKYSISIFLNAVIFENARNVEAEFSKRIDKCIFPKAQNTCGLSLSCL